MTGRAAALLLLGLAACASTAAPRLAPEGAPAPSGAEPPRARVFHSPSDGDFWVEHTRERDLVVASGARLEVRPGGAVTRVAWDLDHASRGEHIIGGLAVPAPLGGGFVFWSRARVFRSPTFTGALEPVAGPHGLGVRGARAGRSSIIVFTDAGPREIPAGSSVMRGLAEPGILDAATMPDGRAVELDVFGRVTFSDPGRAARDLSERVGLGVRRLSMGERDLYLETWEAKLPLLAGGAIGDSVGRPSHGAAASFEVGWDRPRGEDLPWGSGSPSPLAAAIASGGAAGDGTAFGVIQSFPVRVDLASGALIATAPEWISSGLSCQPVRAPDALLFACSWERQQGSGAAVLRARDGGPPVIERAFGEEGSFAAGDAGALAFLGPCRAEPRVTAPEDPARPDEADRVSPVICLRRGPGDWLERRVDLPPGATLLAWAPGDDGRAAALISGGDPLPEPASLAGRAEASGGVSVVRLDRDLDPWAMPRPGSSGDREGLAGFVDRRFSARADGSIDLWLLPVNDGAFAFAAGATLDARGSLTVHPAPPAALAVAPGGAFGLGISRDGELFETLDHGRSYRPAGLSPVPPSAFGRATCSALGCALGSVVRVGFGASAITPEVRSLAPPRATPTPPSRRLACAPVGAPEPLEPTPAAPAGAQTSVSTGWGDTVAIIREVGAPEPATSRPSGAPAARPSKKAPPRASPVVLRTQSMIVRPPFMPRGPARRINVTDASWSVQRRAQITPLLGPRGEVALLLGSDQRDLLLTDDRVTPLGAADARRFWRTDSAGPGGLLLGSARALVLAEHRRRLAIEERAAGASTLPLFIGPDLEQQRKRPFTLGRRDDGAVAILVLDGPAPETAGAAIVDRVKGSAAPVARLAPWSTVVAADDPLCRPDPGAFRALLVIDPTAWLDIDGAVSPGLVLARQGIALVRWGRERVCLEALDVALVDQLTRGAARRAFRLVARWAGEGERGAALRAPDMRQELRCVVR